MDVLKSVFAIFLFHLLVDRESVNGCDILHKIGVSVYDNGASQITRLIVDGKHIPNLCTNAIRNFENLDTLELIDNRMHNVEAGAFKKLPSLESLAIKNNNLTSIGSGVFNRLPIKTLNLTNNLITRIEANAFADLPNLEVLDLERNRIKTIRSEWFANKPAFYRLNLRQNVLRVVPERAFATLAQQNSRTNGLDLWLAFNILNEIKGNAFEGIEEINTLHLENNQLNEEVFDSVLHVKINRLQLNSNNIKCAKDKVLSKLKIGKLLISNNPIDGVCLKSMKKTAGKLSISMDTTFSDLFK